jgi:hypothetical protein
LCLLSRVEVITTAPVTLKACWDEREQLVPATELTIFEAEMLGTNPNRIGESTVEEPIAAVPPQGRRAGARRDRMSTFLRLLLSFATLLTLSTQASAQLNQHLPIRVNIPFDFSAAGSELPAGDYTLSAALEGMELISGKRRTVVAMAPPLLEGAPGKSAVLIFHQVGERYLLAEVWPAGSKVGRVIGGTETLKRRMDSSLTSRVTVIAGRRK